MKPSSQRLTIKPKKDATQAAAAPTIAKNTLPTAHVKTHGITGMKTVKAKIAAGGKPEQQAGVFVAFEGSSVMAHDAVMKGVSGRALTRIWESTRGTLPTDAVLKAIGVSARTAHRAKTEPDKPLDARTTDGIYRLESVRAMAKEVLGSVEAANEWEWWAPKAADVIFQGIFGEQSFEEAVETLKPWWYIQERQERARLAQSTERAAGTREPEQ